MKSQQAKTRFSRGAPLFLLAAAWVLTASCHYYNLAKKLSPDYAEFFSKVRYIISKKEERIFLETPDPEKERFIDEFWQRRDPNPETEENEFKMEYFNRIEKADELFLGEGRPGWMTDRGRIYVLFGPPMDRLINPLGSAYFGRCSEIWYYGGFPVVFTDSDCSGHLQLVTYDLTPIRSTNLLYMQELSRAQAAAQQTIQGSADIFDFSWHLEKSAVEADRFAGNFIVNVPYANIWFSESDGLLKTVLDIRLDVWDGQGNPIWNYEKAVDVSIDEETLKRNKDKGVQITIGFEITTGLDQLRRGRNRAEIEIVNRTGNSSLKKFMEFAVETSAPSPPGCSRFFQ